MIHHNQSHANMHCHCVVIAFYLGGFSHFVRVCERMICEKSFKNINICRYPPKMMMLELADTTQVAGSPHVLQLFFLPRYQQLFGGIMRLCKPQKRNISITKHFARFDLAQTYLQLPLRQWSAGNVYLLMLNS